MPFAMVLSGLSGWTALRMISHAWRDRTSGGYSSLIPGVVLLWAQAAIYTTIVHFALVGGGMRWWYGVFIAVPAVLLGILVVALAIYVVIPKKTSKHVHESWRRKRCLW